MSGWPEAGSVRLAAVFDYGESRTGSSIHDRVHVAGLAEKMDRDDNLCSRDDLPSDFGGVDAERPRVHVGEMGCVVSIDGDEGSLEVSYSQLEPNKLTFRRGDKVEILVSRNNTERFTAEIDHFVKCVRGEAVPLVTGAEAVRALEAVEAVYRSAEHQQAVRVRDPNATSQ